MSRVLRALLTDIIVTLLWVLLDVNAISINGIWSANSEAWVLDSA